MQVGVEAQTAAAALYVALLHEGCYELADEFARWWLSRTGTQVRPAAAGTFHLGFMGSWDADELGIDEEDWWP